jgi:cell division transport system permease protein
MRIQNAAYYTREAFQSMSRNRLLSIATVSTVAICILILGMAALMTLNAGRFIDRLESDVEIVAYLDDSLKSAEVADIKDQIKDMPQVASVQYVSKDQALQRLQKKFGENEYNLEDTLEDNPLPATYEIKARDPHNVPTLAARLGKIEGVYKVNYGRGVVERLFKVTRWIRTLGIVIIALLAFGAVFLIATTIRLAIFARRKQIYLMKLIGATDWFVRWPFFIEGIFIGLLGSLVAIGILAVGYSSLLQNMDQALFFVPLITGGALLLHIYLALVAAGVLLGILGTWISLNRFLDV